MEMIITLTLYCEMGIKDKECSIYFDFSEGTLVYFFNERKLFTE